MSCEVIDDKELKEKIDEKEDKRSSSFFRRKLVSSVMRCAWNFPFKLSFRDKEYEMYAPTRGDRDQWVKVLGTIAEMNR